MTGQPVLGFRAGPPIRGTFASSPIGDPVAVTVLILIDGLLGRPGRRGRRTAAHIFYEAGPAEMFEGITVIVKGEAHVVADRVSQDEGYVSNLPSTAELSPSTGTTTLIAVFSARIFRGPCNGCVLGPVLS